MHKKRFIQNHFSFFLATSWDQLRGQLYFFMIISFFFFLKRRQATRKSSHLVYLLKASERAHYPIWSMRYFKLFASRLPSRSEKRERGPWQPVCIIVAAASFLGFLCRGNEVVVCTLNRRVNLPFCE